jgi:hypothetical protein
MKIKGVPVPEYYTEEDCVGIIYRYWARCSD